MILCYDMGTIDGGNDDEVFQENNNNDAGIFTFTQ